MGNYFTRDPYVAYELNRVSLQCKRNEIEIEQLKTNLYTLSLLLDFNNGMCKSIIEEPDGPPPDL